MKPSFVVGMLLLAHALYAALSMQDELQAHHHGLSGSSSTMFIRNLVGSGGATSEAQGASLPLWVIVEVLIGCALAMFGYVANASFHKIRLVDHQCDARYEHAVYTGNEFLHFNHRGSVVSSARAPQGVKS